MAAQSDSALGDLFESLSNHIASEEHKKAARKADEILAIVPNDSEALACKVVAAIRADNYDGAIALINRHASLSTAMSFEKAYCLYKLGKFHEALELVHSGEASNPKAWLQLQAQLHYRLNQNKESIKAYDRLFKDHKVESLDLKTNVTAAYVAAELSSEVPGLMTAMQVSSKQSFELGFNKACALLMLGDFAAAESELRQALKLGGETLFDQELSEEDVAEELSPLTVQLGYCLERLGRVTEAQELYEKVLSNSAISYEEARTVAHNNTMACSCKVETGAAHKKYVNNAAKRLEGMLDKEKPAPLKLSPELELRMAPSQKKALHLNRALLYWLCGRYDAARDTVAAVAKQYGESTPVVLLRAALLASEGKVSDADALLDKYSSCVPPAAALHPTLMRAQLALEAGGSPTRALELLSSLNGPEDVVQSGALLASRLALYQQLGDVAGAEAMLDSALAYWRQRAASAPPSAPAQPRQTSRQQSVGEAAAVALDWCLQGLVGLKLKLGKISEAVDCCQALCKQQTGGRQASLTSQSTAVLGRLMRALAASDPEGAVRMEGQLQGISDVEIRRINVDELEQYSRGGPAAFKKKEAKKRDADHMDVEQQHKKKKPRKHKKVLPKGYNPELPGGGLPAPDPERWLPKWQRAEFKKRKTTSAQRKNEQVKGSQGAGKVDENLDRSKALPPSQEAKQQAAKPSLPARKGKGKK